MWLDNRGRLFGRFSVVDLAAVLTLIPVFLFFNFAFRVFAHRTLSLYSVTPVRIQAGSEEWIRITGTGMDNTCRVRFSPQYEFQDTYVLNQATLETHLPDHVLPWQYDVVVRNDRGHTDILRAAIVVYWIPHLERVVSRKSYIGETIQLVGDYFQPDVQVWIGGRRVKNVEQVDPQHLSIRLSFDEDLKPGVYDIRASNGSPELEGTLPKAVELLLKPRVTEIFPRKLLHGNPVDVVITGENFPRDAMLLLGHHNIPLETIWVNSNQLRAHIVPDPRSGDTYDLYLEIPDGPRIKVFSSAITIVPQVVQPVLVEVSLEQLAQETLDNLRGMIGWNSISRSRRAPGNYVVRMVLPAVLNGEPGGTPPMNFTYRGQRIMRGKSITLKLAGKTVEGIILSDPFPVFFNGEDLNMTARLDLQSKND